MREHRDAFHLAIPTRDLDESQEYYSRLGCKVARRYEDRITFDFFGDQVVCHLSPRHCETEPDLYPRHFGVTFSRRVDFEALLRLVELRKLEVFRPLSRRFEGLAEEHRTVVLKDPSGNLIEFKHYLDPRLLY